MPVDELIDQLASLSLRAGPAVKEGTSEKLEYKNKGGHAVKQLEAHLARVRDEIAGAGSPKSLGDAAKQEGRGLLKIAQAGLRNTTGGLEPLRLAYEASRTLLPLSSFIVAADLTMERLWYKVASRCVELGDYALGLRAAACLQACLDQRRGDDLAGGAGGVENGDGCSVALGPDGEEGVLRLRSFAPPGASSSVALAKLVSGASLNACRCCLEVGTRDTLRLMTGELGRSAGGWIDRVSELGDAATADSYRGLLFKQLWLGCAALEKPSLAATSRDCLLGRQAALGVLLRMGDSWNPDVFVAHALRAAVALQERAASGIDSASAGDAAELSAFCLEGLSDREGEGWPAGVDGNCQEPETLHSSWVDWLQHSAGLHQNVGQAAEAQRLLQLAYEYVQRCRKQLAESGGGHAAAECAAYAGILKLHTAAMLTSLHPPDGAAASAPPLAGKQAAKKRAGKKSAESPKPSSAVLVLTSRGLDYLGDVVAALEALAGGEDGAPRAGTGAETAAFIGAAVKAWTRAKKSCAVVALWVEEEVGGGAKNPGELEHSDWSALSARGRLVLGVLSLKLALVRENKSLGRVLERLPSMASLFQLAVDNYIRVAHAHLGTLASENKRGPDARVGNARSKSPGTIAAEDARQALAAAEQTLETAGDVFPSPVSKRVGTGWFGLGTSLLDRGETDAGLDALVRGCRLLESWTEGECDRPGRSNTGEDGDSSGPGLIEVLRSVQLDMRLAKLSLALQDSSARAMAAAAAARALAFCPGMWCFSAEGQPESPAGVLALVERFVACKLGCASPVGLSSASGGVGGATAETLSAYLSGGVDLPTALEKRGFPPVAIVWVILATCRVYRAHLRKSLSEQAGSAASGKEEEEEEEEGEEGGTLLACVEGHRLATEAILGICCRCRSDEGEDGMNGWQNRADMWEAHARLLAAKFEHDLHLAKVTAIDHDNTEGVSADLLAGIRHAASGAATASRLGGGDEGLGSGSPVAAAAGGVLACIRAMLHRAVAEGDDDAKTAMRQSLDLFDRAARDPEWRPQHSSPANVGPTGMGSITDSLGLLEAHYTLHGDSLRRAKVGEVRLALADRAGSEMEKGSLPQGLASSAAALGCIGNAFQAGGFPGLGPVYCAAANEELVELAEPKRRGAGAGADRRTDSIGSSAKTESVRVAVDILRGMCLAEPSGGEEEAESVLFEARRAMAVSDPDSRVVSPVTAAYLECVAGLGLSWMYQRSGRLAEAMGEVRQVMRLCRTWASAGGPLVVSDKQVVALSAEKGRCIHDEGSDGLDAGASQAQAEEGIGAEGGDVEETMADGGSDDGGRGATVLSLGSRWIPVYLEGLTRMGRLWRERGIASKASLTLRQGCVMSESLHAARFLRHCLLEEVEVATAKHLFDRAERLLRASQELLHRERRELASTDGSSTSPSECAACQALDPASAEASETPVGSAAKGKGSKRESRKPGGKKKTLAASPTAVAGSAEGSCLRCHELAVNAAEVAVAEASLLRKQGGFEGALAACERGQSVLAPLVRAAGQPVSWSGSISFARVSSEHARAEGAEGDGLGWRAAEVLAMLRLQQGRVCCLLGNTAAGEELLQDCSSADGAPALVRATALYRIGRMSLDAGDAAGARLPLEKSEALCRGAGVPKLVRKVRRVLAVTLTELAGQRGSGDVGVDASWRVAALSSLSVGVTHCNQVTHASARRTRKGDVDGAPKLSAGMQLFDVVSGRRGSKAGGCTLRKDPEDICGGGCLKDAVTSDLRAEWPIISLCVAPGKGVAACMRLLLTRLARGRPPLTLSVPLSPDDAQLLERWRGIMDENRDTLRGHSAEEAAKYGNQQKARWWERRVAVDEMVNDVLGQLEERWFGAHGLAAVLLGDVVGEELGLELESVVQFANERIRVARGDAPAGKGPSRTKGGKKPRGAAAPAGGGGTEAKGGRSSALSELIRVCVRGGEVMGQEAWLAVVQLALSGSGSEPLAAKVSREIHEKVQAVFAADEAKFGRSITHAAAAAVDPRWSPDSDIEKGRSSTSAQRAEVVHSAAVATSSALATSGASMDEEAMSKMKVADLRRALSSRGVPTTGLKLKSDLLAKLVEVVRGEAEGRAGDGGADDRCVASPAAKSADGGDDSDALRLSTPDGRGGAATTKTKGRVQAVRTPAAGTSGRVGGSDSGGGGGGDGGDGARGSGGGAERHPVVLVLDEQLQAIPWEGLPSLRGHAVTRVPAVPFVFAALETRWDGGDASGTGVEASGGKGRGKGKGKSKPAPARNFERPWIPSQGGVRPDRGYYVLDPEANLPHTRKQLGPVFQGLGRRLGWSGVQGETPTEDAMAQTLEEVDIFAYCGHGAGELLVGRDAVAGLTKCAVAVLMGCSSGRLKGYGDFEPMGMATSYLAGGSPAVVANLWDVTDKDIDRFSVALLEAFLGEGGGGKGKSGNGRALTLAHAVAESRSECKMPFIIGYAPVCYGIPVAVATSPLS